MRMKLSPHNMNVFPKSVKIPKCRGKYLLSKVIPNARHGEVGVYEKVEHDATAPDLVYLSFYQASHFIV